MLGNKRKERLMPRFIILAIVLVAVTTASCLADQLAWNSRRTCEEAAKSIGQGSILLSYCSLCSNERVEVWLVKGINVTPTTTNGLFEVNVFGTRLYTSMETLRDKQYSESVQYEAVTGKEPARWFATAIDLAYVYVPTGEGTFRCLGKVIERACSIKVDTISLPYQLLEQATREVGRESKKMMLTWQ